MFDLLVRHGWRTAWAGPGAVLGLAGCGSAATPGVTGTPTPPSVSSSAGSETPSSGQLARMDGISMLPTLTSGELLTVLPLPSSIARGQIILLRPPGDITQAFIKRTIGVPGDAIEINTVTASDGTRRAEVLIEPAGTTSFQVLSEPYLPHGAPWTENGYCCDASGRATTQAQPVTIPPGEYFFLGDNRNVSEDSRALGFVPASDLLGMIQTKTYPTLGNVEAGG